MSNTYTVEPGQTMAGVAKHWGWLLVLGLATVVLGILFVVNTGGSLTFVLALFGWYLLISGVFQLVQAFRVRQHTALFAISGVLSIILGVWALKNLVDSAVILAIFIGFAWLFRGIVELVVGIQSKGEDGRGWLITGGILMILGAIVIFVWPAATLLVIVWVSGIMLIVLGITEIIGAFQMRKLAST